MTLVIFSLVVVNLMLGGALVIAKLLAVRHGDTTAAYPLFAVRDQLIRAVVVDAVPRNDPWLVALYGGVNSILVHSNLISGPDGWPDAVAAGRLMVTEPRLFNSLPTLPDAPVPSALVSVLPGLDQALTDLTAKHFGFALQRSASQRELMKQQRDLQMQKATQLRASLRSHVPQLV